MTTAVTADTHDFTHQFHAAYAATAADRDALAPSELLPVNLDVQLAITTVLGVMPRLSTLRAEIAATFPAEYVAPLDKAEAYARALAYAQTVYLAASTPTEALPELAERAMKCRDMLLSDAKALAHRGLVDPKPLAELKGGTGYLNIASDLGVLVRILRERWSVVAPKSAIQSAELDEAEQIFEQITMAYAERSRQSTQVADAVDDRRRAFTLLVKTYDQVRRAVTFLRWENEDAEKFAPSLWAGRGGRGSKSDDATKPEPQEPSPTPTPPPAPVVPPVTSSPTTSPGLPGNSPFADN